MTSMHWGVLLVGVAIGFFVLPAVMQAVQNK